MSNKEDGPNEGQVAKRHEELLSDVDSLSPEQLETGVQVAEEFTDRHLASQARQNQAKEGSTLSQAKRHFTWALCYTLIILFVFCGIMLIYLIATYGHYLSKTPEQVGVLLWAIFTHSSVAAASLYFQKVLRRNLD